RRIEKKVAPIPLEKRPRVFWEMYNDPLMTAGKDTFQSEAIEIAGGVNIFSDLPGSWPIVNQEEVIRRNPDVIMGSDDHEDKLTVEQIARRPGWSELNAVKNRRIYLISGDQIGRAGPRLVDAIEAMAKALYPELFK
ncbi:MAG TPA: ABC transporter substrate-binding protein, partial [Spirochaetia bacterium]|nr:ABC transporter substrate-binding protein [Spirochaetia bacterium]